MVVLLVQVVVLLVEKVVLLVEEVEVLMVLLGLRGLPLPLLPLSLSHTELCVRERRWAPVGDHLSPLVT